MLQLQVALRGLPVVAVLIAPGKCAIVKRAEFSAILEVSQGAYAHLFSDRFVVFSGAGFEEYEYNVAYELRHYPALLKWLVEMNLQSPV